MTKATIMAATCTGHGIPATPRLGRRLTTGLNSLNGIILDMNDLEAERYRFGDTYA